MLSFLKQLFSSELEHPEEAEKVLTFEEIGSLLTEKLSAKLNFYQEKLDEEHQNLLSFRTKVQEKLNLLIQAGFKNPDMPEQAKQYVHTHRDEFVKKINAFLQKIQRPEILDLNYCPQLKSEYEFLVASLNKQYYILQEFFSQETKDLWDDLHEFEKLLPSVKLIYSAANLKQINQLINDFENLKNLLKKKEELEKNVSFAEVVVKEKEQYARDVLAKIEDIKKSPEYFEQEKETLVVHEDLNVLENEISYYFSSISPLLDVYSKATVVLPLVHSYIQKPVEAFQEDLHMKIREVIENVRQSLNAGSFEFNHDDKEKILAVLHKLTPELLEDFSKRYVGLKTKKEIVMREKPILKTLDEEEKKFESAKQEIEYQKQRKQELLVEKEKIDDVKLKNEFVQKVNKEFSV